jgi:hypothetical protein
MRMPEDFSQATLVEYVVKTPKNDKHKEYSHYAEHCLQMVPKIPDQEYRAIQREMAAEWIKLAEAVLRPLIPINDPKVIGMFNSGKLRDSASRLFAMVLIAREQGFGSAYCLADLANEALAHADEIDGRSGASARPSE